MLLNWYSTLGQGGGYSGSAENMIIALAKQGIDVRFLSTSSKLDREILHSRATDIVQKTFKPADIGIIYDIPKAFTLKTPNKIRIGFTMFETDTLPNGFGYGGIMNDWTCGSDNVATIINSSLDYLFVPSEHNKELFLKSGVEIPIFVIPLGVDPEVYYDFSLDRRKTRKSRPFTFLSLGTLNGRKNVEMTIKAFWQLFGNNNDAKLILKTQKSDLSYLKINIPAKNIEIIDEVWDTKQMQELFAQCDCFVFPSKGEGFGLPPLEAMATGMPTIVSDNSGMSDYADMNYCYPIPTKKLEEAYGFSKKWGNVGNWYLPEIEILKQHMWYVYKNENIATIKSEKAASWVSQNWTYEKSAQKIIKILNQINVN